MQVSNTIPFPHHNTHSHCLQSSGDTPGLAQAALCPISGPDSCSFLLWDHLEDPNILILTLQCPSAGKQPHHSKPHQQLHSHGHSKAQKKTRELLGRGEPRPPHCLHGVLGWDLLPPAAWEQSPAPARSTRVTSVLSLLLHQTPEQSRALAVGLPTQSYKPPAALCHPLLTQQGIQDGKMNILATIIAQRALYLAKRRCSLTHSTFPGQGPRHLPSPLPLYGF